MPRKLDDLTTCAAQALEFSAHAVARRGILPLPDQLSKDAAHAIALLANEMQVDHLRLIGYTNVADLLAITSPKPPDPDKDPDPFPQFIEPAPSDASSPRPSHSTENSPSTPRSE